MQFKDVKNVFKKMAEWIIQYAIERKTLIRVYLNINSKASVLNMNCYYVTVVDCLKVAPRKIQHDSWSLFLKQYMYLHIAVH